MSKGNVSRSQDRTRGAVPSYPTTLDMVPSNMALQRTRRPRIRSGRSLCSLGSPLNARPLGDRIR